jgi:Disulphide bond corrector protein DsbC
VRGLLAVTLLVATAPLLAQDTLPLSKTPKVTVAPISTVHVNQGGSAPLLMTFRVVKGYHINSNQPSSELLIPTAVKFDLPTDVSIGKTQYPQGHEYSFSFSPDEKMSVYTGDFTVKALVIATKSAPRGPFRIHGSLRYQACDNRACYPPASVPVEFNVNVSRPVPKTVKKNPGQSPHIHK